MRFSLRLRWVAVWLLVGVVASVAVLAVEVVIALRSPKLPDTQPYDLRRTSSNPDATRVVWLGDSTAAGVGASSADRSLPLQIGTDNDTDITVLAISGATVEDVLKDQVPLMPDAVDHVYISVGANDVTHRTSAADFTERYQNLLNSIPPSIEITVLGVPDMGSPTRIPQPLRSIVGFRGRQLDDIVERAARAAGAAYVDIEARTGPSFRKDPARYFAADKFHPSDDGYALWADAIGPSTRS